MDVSARTGEPGRSAGVTSAVQHALCWLVVGNAIGVMIAVLLLLPGLNVWLGEWTYGRWMMVHMNVLLFGWCSIPMLALLFKAYRVDRGRLAAWSRPVVWVWSAALIVGSYSWLQGHSSGKLFLDWSGYSRIFFPFALLCLWAFLAYAFAVDREQRSGNLIGIAARILGLFALLPVPVALYMASNPRIYPAINPDTGGPTGASQLESTLGVVLILLALPFAVAPRRHQHIRIVIGAWIAFLLELLLLAIINGGDVSHRVPAQYLSLASVLIWIPLIPAYYRQFEWNSATRRWRTAFLWWWTGLVLSGWIMFLPGILERIKFTDVLVGHSLVAVAGFLSAYVIFILVQILGEVDAWILNRTWSFYAWNMGVLAYVIIIMVAGWLETTDPAFTISPGLARNIIYVIRLLTGVSMLAGSLEWFIASLALRTEKTVTESAISGVKVA